MSVVVVLSHHPKPSSECKKPKNRGIEFFFCTCVVSHSRRTPEEQAPCCNANEGRQQRDTNQGEPQLSPPTEPLKKIHHRLHAVRVRQRTIVVERRCGGGGETRTEHFSKVKRAKIASWMAVKSMATTTSAMMRPYMVRLLSPTHKPSSSMNWQSLNNWVRASSPETLIPARNSKDWTSIVEKL